MRGFRSSLAGIAVSALTVLSASAQDAPLKITVLHQSTVDDVFWQGVNRGMSDACELVNADCQMVFNRQESDIAGLIGNIEAAMAGQPDALVIAVADATALDGLVQQARDNGIIVLGINQDDPEGALGNARQAYVGQDDEAAGFNLARHVAESFPADGPINVLIGVNMPGAAWSEDRARGLEIYFARFSEDHPDREINVRRIDVGVDGGVVATRVLADLQINPDTTAYIETGYFVYTVARAMRENGDDPANIILAGFDIIAPVLEELKTGYIDFQSDQQPYLQGFLPVIQVDLMKKYGLSGWDVNTGGGVVTPADAAQLEQYIAMGVR